jgi:hypothetical protein
LEFIDTTWPLVVVRLPAAMNDPRVVEQFTRQFNRVYARGERFAAMIDCSSVSKFPGAVERKMLTDWLSDERRVAQERQTTLGSALVLTSGTMRAVVSAMYWIKRPTTPQVWKGTSAEAIDWCCERLREAGVPLTPAIEALRVRQRR